MTPLTVPPLFSLIIPTHCRAMLLERALSSVRDQGCDADLEIIVVSDVADSATDLVCAQWLTSRDTYVRRSGQPGPSASRNLAMDQAKGQYLVFLDDDDSLSPNFLAELMQRPQIAANQAVVVNCMVVSESRLPTGPQIHHEAPMNRGDGLTDLVYVKNQLPFSCFVFPRSMTLGLRFDTHMRAYEDWEFVLGFLQRGWPEFLDIMGPRIHTVPDETTDRRGASAHAKDFRAVLDYLYVYHRYPAPNAQVQQQRAAMMQAFGIGLPPEVY